ncbi:hypothetical protein QQ045_028736 [Rhodiola kirilowii]
MQPVIAIFAALFFGLFSGAAGKLYNLLPWKKQQHKKTNRIDKSDVEQKNSIFMCNNGVRVFCWPKASSLHNNVSQEEEEKDVELGSTDDVEELMRINNLLGPSRFLFTIEEETDLDLGSDDGKHRTRTRLIDLMRAEEDANFLSPIASPAIKSLTSINTPFDFNGLLDSYCAEASLKSSTCCSSEVQNRHVLQQVITV